MIEVRLVAAAPGTGALAVPVRASGDHPCTIDPESVDNDELLLAELTAFAEDVDHRGGAGAVQTLARPARKPSAVLLVGVGAGGETDWRAAGAAVVRASSRFPAVHLPLPDDLPAGRLRAVAEGAALASYKFRLAPEDGDKGPKLRRLTVATALPAAEAQAALAQAEAVCDAVVLARDLTNMPSRQKSPSWFVDRVAAAATRRGGVRVKIFDTPELEQGGFGGILAVGGGSPRPPRLLELSWRPPTPRRAPRPAHVVLVGKGITFDTGGISIKTLEGMKLMRKDMGGAAAVCATVLAVADLGLPVRVTALAPLAENLVSGSAYRPGDVVRHYGGITSEVQNTDAEGRVVLGDALAYAAKRLSPDVIVDLATLTGASHVALGKRIAAVLADDDALAAALVAAGDEVGERLWRLPLAEDYVGLLASDVADLTNSPAGGAGGVITAALYLREFTGDARSRWAHIDMSAPAWSDSDDGLLAKGATGWGVRMLVRWLSGL